MSDEDVPFKVNSVTLKKDDKKVRLQVELENTTDMAYRLLYPMITVNDITYDEHNAEKLESHTVLQDDWSFGRASYYIPLINTHEITEIRIPVYYNLDMDAYVWDVVEKQLPCAVLHITTQINTNDISTDSPVLGTGSIQAYGTELPVEIISIEQKEDSSITIWGVVENNTEEAIYYTARIGNAFADGISTSGVETVYFGALPDTKGLFSIELDNQLETPYTLSWTSNFDQSHPMVANALSQSSVSSFSRFEAKTTDDILSKTPLTMSFTLNEPFTLQPAEDYTTTTLFEVEGWKMEAVSLSVLNDDTNGYGLCLLAKVTHEGGRADLNPGITSWYINGERMKPIYARFYENAGIPEGTSQMLCLFMDIPEGAEEISELKLFCVLHNEWPNKEDGLAEIVLSEPLMLDHTYTIPGSELTIVPAQF